MLAAYTIGLLLQSSMDGTPFDTGGVWKSLVLMLVLVFFRFLFDYLRARFQEAISYELVARDRLAVGDALKRVSLGYFQQVSTGNILNSLTTGLGTLEGMGIRMIDNFVGGYLNFAVVFLSLLVFSPARRSLRWRQRQCRWCFCWPSLTTVPRMPLWRPRWPICSRK